MTTALLRWQRRCTHMRHVAGGNAVIDGHQVKGVHRVRDTPGNLCIPAPKVSHAQCGIGPGEVHAGHEFMHSTATPGRGTALEEANKHIRRVHGPFLHLFTKSIVVLRQPSVSPASAAAARTCAAHHRKLVRVLLELMEGLLAS